MPDSSPCKKKKKYTIVANEKGVKTADKSLIRLGFNSQIDFAESQRLSRSTVNKFFNKIPIQLDSFKKICEALKLKWQEIAEITQESINHEQIEENQVNFSSEPLEEGVKVKMLVRQVTSVEKTGQKNHLLITLEGDIDLLSKIQIIAITAILKEDGRDTIQITDIQEGSIKLIIEGSQEDIERLLNQIESGELTELDGFPVEDAQRLSETLEDDESSEQKWRLVEEIATNQIIGRDLSGADLSDADLRNAFLIGANLSEADLSDSDLRDANLRDANLSLTNLRGANLRDANLRDADLSGTNLSSATLIRANLIRANLIRADLRDAHLRGADLRGADLKDADLRDADLRDADLSGADLSGADLRGANQSDAKVETIRFLGFGITEEPKEDRRTQKRPKNSKKT